MTKETRGLLLGFIGVAGFSLTPPATRAAVLHLDPLFVTYGRAVLAGVIAALILGLSNQRWPPRHTLLSLAVVAACIVIIFPLLLALALRTVPAAHTGVMLGILPLMTVIVATLRCKESPSPLFWCVAVLGGGVVMGYALMYGEGAIQAADGLLVIAVVIAAVGYAEGARLGKSLGSWQTVCWALVVGAPILLLPLIIMFYNSPIVAPTSAWVGFFYVALVSQLFAFFPWYHGMAIAGTAKVSQIMLLMPLMTIVFSSTLLLETVDGITWLFAGVIVMIVALSWRLPVRRTDAP